MDLIWLKKKHVNKTAVPVWNPTSTDGGRKEGRLYAGQLSYALQFGEENKLFDIKSTQSLISLQEINKLPISLWSYSGQG